MVRIISVNYWYLILYSIWNIFLEEVFFLQDVISSRYNPDKLIVSPLHPKNDGIWGRLEWIWHVQLQPIVFKLLSVLFATLSLVIIWSEMTNFVDTVELSVFARIIHSQNISFSGIEVQARGIFKINELI